MGYYTRGADDLVLRGDDLVGIKGQSGNARLLTTEEVRRRLNFAHVRHIYWLVEQGYLPFRKFGRELVFLEKDLDDFHELRRQQYPR